MSKPRPDGRADDALRPLRITPDFLSHPLSSALIEVGGTKVICSASFDTGVPPWMRQQNVPGGWVTCEYGMLPASTHSRMQRESAKGKQSGRTMEIQRLIGRSFRSVVNLRDLGANTLTIDCDVMDADGGTRCASITGVSVVLQIAFRRLLEEKKIPRFPMRENVAAVSVGLWKGCSLLDLCYEEDSAADVDMNVVMTESGRFVEVQGTAEEQPFTRTELDRMLDLAKKGLDELFRVQKEAIDRAVPPPPESFGSLGSVFSNLPL